MSCPVNNAKGSLEAHGSHGVAAAEMPPLRFADHYRLPGVVMDEGWIKHNNNWFKLERALQAYLAGAVDIKTIERVVGVDEAIAIADALPKFALIDRRAQEYAARLAEDGLPPYYEFQKQVLKAAGKKSKVFYVRNEINRYMRWLYGRLFAEGYLAGRFDEAELDRLADESRLVGLEAIQEIAPRIGHTLTADEYVAFVAGKLNYKRSPDVLKREHIELVRKALEAGLDVPERVRGDYADLERVRSMPKSKILPEKFVPLARLALKYPSEQAAREAAANRVRDEYGQYARLVMRVQAGDPLSEEETEQFPLIAESLRKKMSWAWPDLSIHFPNSTKILYLRDYYRLPGGGDVERMVNNAFDAIPPKVRKLIYDETGCPRPVYILQGDLSPADYEKWETHDREMVNAWLAQGGDVPLHVLMQYPDLVAQYGL